MGMNRLTATQADDTLSRREKHVARLLPKVEALLIRRAEESPCADGFRFEPLAVLVREMGYTLTASHPFGNPRSRDIVTDALAALGRAGPFVVSIRSVTDWLYMQPRNPIEGNPQPRGVQRDPVWVAYWMKDAESR
jgi:hypothetical protein